MTDSPPADDGRPVPDHENPIYKRLEQTAHSLWARGQESAAAVIRGCVAALKIRQSCDCACCAHNEGSDCACECHATGKCSASLASATRANDEQFKAHTEAVADFLNELYAIMVDPCAEGTITVAEMKDALIKAAIRDRDAAASAPRAPVPVEPLDLDPIKARFTKLRYGRGSMRSDVKRLIAEIERLRAQSGSIPHETKA